MFDKSMFNFFADIVLIAHVLFVCFVVFGLVLIFVGYFLKWSWVRNKFFRVTHLIAIGIVVLQSWLGVVCPLTTWEMTLREKAGVETYSGSFIQYWLQKLLFYSAPEWVFVVIYTGFGTLILLSWFLVRPGLSVNTKNAS